MDVAKVERRLRSTIEAGHAVGISLAVIEDGKLAFTTGSGMTATGGVGAPATADTLFAYGSICKTICATLVMRLVQQGVLELDRPLLTYLPALSFSNEDAGSQLTLRHILSHTSGLPAAGRDYGPRGAGALQAVIEDEIPHYTFLASPGELHLYSNGAFCIAGYAAEMVSGMRYDMLVQKYVLEPLRMKATTFRLSRMPAGLLALPHEGERDEWQPVTRLPANGAGHPSSFAYGTASDLANLALVHLNGGRFQGQRYLSRHLLEEMQREHTSRHIAGAAHPLAHVSSGYGLGLMTGTYRGQRVLRHGGMALSYNCFFELLPDARCGFVLLTNAAVEERLMELVVFLYDELLNHLPHNGVDPLPAPEPFENSEERQRWPLYEGAFLNVAWGSLVGVGQTSNELLLLQGNDKLPLTCIGPGQYYAVTEDGRRLPVGFVGTGEPLQHMFVAGQPYHRHTGQGMGAESNRWLSFTGSYRDPYNLNDEEVLHLRYADGHADGYADGRLWLREANGKEFVCEPLGGLSFRCDTGMFELHQDPRNGTRSLFWGKAIRYWCISED